MATDLFLSSHGLDPRGLVDAVPPACRTSAGISAPRVTEVARADRQAEWLIEVPELVPRCAAVHLVPSFSALTSAAVSFRFEVSVRLAGAWSSWVAADAIGPAVFEPLPLDPTPLSADIDQFTTLVPLETIRLRLRWRGEGAPLAAPWVITLSASDEQISTPTGASMPMRGARLTVPAISQMLVDGPSAMRICSPTSVAMVLGYWGCDVPALLVAEQAFHPATDRYGVWPAAIAAAARHGVAGYLLRFPDWPSAAWCLEHDMPVVASIRFSAGELQGAPLAETSGHLVVLTGYDGAHVLVNDPAAAAVASVPRRYVRSELERAWLRRGGIGYVLFRPAYGRG